MSDISLSIGPLDLFGFMLFSAWPMIVVGAVCGALVWRRRRWLGAGIGVVVGFAAGAAGFSGWEHSRLSIHVDYFTAVERGMRAAALGAAATGALGGWLWRADRERGAVLAGLAGGALGFAIWIGFSGAF
jgi:hypothetical protein